MAGPEGIIWIVTSRCDLHCRHCYSDLYMKEVEMKAGEALKVVREAAEAGVGFIHYTGGEPLFRPDIYTLLRETKERGLGSSVFTNSMMVNEEIVRKLRAIDVKVYTSMDGPSKGVHEAHRGPGTWERFLKGFEQFVKEGLHVHVNVTISELNWRWAGETVAKAFEFGAGSVSIIPTMPVGRAAKEGISVKPDHFVEALQSTALKAKELGEIVAVWCAPFVRAVTDSRHVVYGCCRERDIMDITPSGRFVLCDVLGYEISSVKESGVKRAWERFLSHPIYSKISRPRLRGPCTNCRVRHACKGGCYARSWLVGRGMEGPDPLCPLAS